jgi:hypothetical protein
MSSQYLPITSTSPANGMPLAKGVLRTRRTQGKLVVFSCFGQKRMVFCLQYLELVFYVD